MADCQITRIRKPDRFSPHEHITHVGGPTWVLTREQAIQCILSATDTFYVVDAITGKRSNVAVVAATPERIVHLRTHADGLWNDNLLSLPEIA